MTAHVKASLDQHARKEARGPGKLAAKLWPFQRKTTVNPQTGQAELRRLHQMIAALDKRVGDLEASPAGVCKDSAG